MAPNSEPQGIPLGNYKDTADTGLDDPLIHKVGYPPRKTFREEVTEFVEQVHPLKKYQKRGRRLSQRDKLKLAAFYVAPWLEWATSYKLEYLRGDIVGGLTIAVMAVPQVLNLMCTTHYALFICQKILRRGLTSDDKKGVLNNLPWS